MNDAREFVIEEIRELDRFDSLREPWNRLLAASEHDLPFLSHEWLRLWWKHFGGNRRLAVFWVLRGGHPVLAVPLMEVRSRFLGLPFTVLQSMTNEHSFRFDLILRRRAEDAVEALFRHLVARGGWNLVQLRDVVTLDCSAEQLLQIARSARHPTGVWRSYESPFLVPDGSFEQYKSHLKPKLRRNLRNRMKRLSALGGVTFEIVEDPARAGALLPMGFALEGSGWKREAGSAIASDPTLTAFYGDWARLAGERGWLRLHFLRVGGRYIAFDYSLRYGGRVYCLKIGYDPEFAPYSAGQLLKERILQRVHAEEVREYDFLGPMIDAKRDWNPQSRRHAWLFLYGRDPRSRLAHAYKFGLRAGVRRLLGP
ncbi:MAG TPA: GNAT family N-acetyltransferase [Candidatus Eisenbacteria bacterium]|jgi:CelD/BcsL family acetyltransferase involved in cellulose biosynthesis